MIEIEVSPEKIVVSRHAGFDKKGKDIVCAGVSALVFTFIKSVDKLLGIELKVISGDGLMDIDIPENEKINILK